MVDVCQGMVVLFEGRVDVCEAAPQATGPVRGAWRTLGPKNSNQANVAIWCLYASSNAGNPGIGITLQF